MASVDKVKIGTSTYDVSPSKDGTLTGYTSNDSSSATSWTAVDAIAATETNSSIFSKLTKMVKNIRFLYGKLGTSDFSGTGASTVTEALANLQSNKAASTHSHTTANLPISSTQINSTAYIPTSSLIYSMNQTLTSLNDASTNHESRISALESSGGISCEMVSYTGNNRYGVNNPTSLLFSFAPSTIICIGIKAVSSDLGYFICNGYYYNNNGSSVYKPLSFFDCTLLENPDTYYSYAFGRGEEKSDNKYYATTLNVKKSLDGKNISFYSTSNYGDQYNMSSYVFYWLGIK